MTEADQAVIDDLVESGIAGCKWKRPQERTPSCADLRAEVDELRQAAAKPAPPAPAVKPSLLQRLKAKLKRK